MKIRYNPAKTFARYQSALYVLIINKYVGKFKFL